MIKVFKSNTLLLVAAPGGGGIIATARVFSPQRKLKLLAIDIDFNSYNSVTSEWDNPMTDRFNYFNAQLDSTGGVNPFYDATGNVITGTPLQNSLMLFTIPGNYKLNLQYDEEILMSIWTYNYSAVNHTHAFQVLFTVDEK